jgi:hypothetical protein
MGIVKGKTEGGSRVSGNPSKDRSVDGWRFVA